jgi:HicB-like protein involved in pilus formation
MSKKEKDILRSSVDVAANSATWADLSNALFDPVDGLITKAYPTREERAVFLQTGEYKKIRQLISDAMDRTGLVAGATPKKSGKFVVRLPKSLHAALDREATEEGVSLNQLVVTKLAVQMSRLASGPNSDMTAIAQAYLEVRDGYSTDRVVADPQLNRLFLQRCRELGLTGTDFDLNWRLFNGRKNKLLKDMPKTRQYTSSRKDEFEFSSEIAVRVIQEEVRRTEDRSVSLDRIICDPDLAARFDSVAERLAPGFAALDYRWIAFGVRKAAGRYASQAKEITVPSFDFMGRTKAIRASRIPTDQGLYMFCCGDDPLFVGETDDLRGRIERHFAVSDHVGLPDWLYDRGRRALSLGILPMPSAKVTERKIVEVGAVALHHPMFNYITTMEAA